MQDLIDYRLFGVNDWSFTLGQLGWLLLLVVLSVFGFRLLTKSAFLSRMMKNSHILPEEQKKLRKQISYFLVFLVILLFVLIANFDALLPENTHGITISLILEVILIIQGARIVDWIISNLFIHKYYSRRDKPDPKKQTEKKYGERSASRIVQYIVYLGALLFLIQKLELNDTFYRTTIKDKDVEWTVSNIIIFFLILLIARLIIWLITQLFLYGIYRRKGIDKGSQFAINQLITYFIYVIAVFVALENLGINMTLIWTGAAALLVGIGLGVQQTFNDFFSGLLLLFERSTSVGDVLEINGMVGRVQSIGMRASIIETRFKKTVVVPNSKLVNDNVTNWSHYNNRVRFEVSVGVAYGSDTALVKKILIDVANDHPDVLDYPPPFVRFQNFGNSSLDFSLSFFSRNYMLIEDVMSDIRFEIDRQFREHGVTIPFPQRDVWFRNK